MPGRLLRIGPLKKNVVCGTSDPLYRILTMDRTAEPAGYRRMKTLLILFAGVHILIGGAFSILIKA